MHSALERIALGLSRCRRAMSDHNESLGIERAYDVYTFGTRLLRTKSDTCNNNYSSHDDSVPVTPLLSISLFL
jgi:hypothetical protein